MARLRKPAEKPAAPAAILRVIQRGAAAIREGAAGVGRDELAEPPGDVPDGYPVRVDAADGTVLAWGLFEAGSQVPVRILHRRAERIVNEDFVRGAVQRAEALRGRVLDRSAVEAWRLVHGEGDGLPGVEIDVFGRFARLRLQWRAWAPWREFLADAIEDLVAPEGILEAPPPFEPEAPPFRVLRGEKPPPVAQVKEAPWMFDVRLREGLKTGLFLDKREARRVLARHAPGRRVLNTFSYAGAFSVAAASAGAARVTSLDLAGKCAEWGKENFRRNGLDPEAHEFVKGDVFRTIEEWGKEKRLFDLVLLDPPSFATGPSGTFAPRQGLGPLFRLALGVLAPEGLLVVCNSTRRIPSGKFLADLAREAGAAGRDAHLLESCGLPPDFPTPADRPEERYFKFLVCRVS